FQAEDGIRDDLVTGVQTCALPISATATLSVAVAVTLRTPATVVPAVGEVTATVGGVVSPPSTVTLTEGAVAVLPAASRATAVRLWAPGSALLVFQATEYGATVTSAPRVAPSSLNWTPATPPAAAAVAIRVTTPLTLEPDSGAVTVP